MSEYRQCYDEAAKKKIEKYLIEVQNAKPPGAQQMNIPPAGTAM